jgi:hypothetical protein
MALAPPERRSIGTTAAIKASRSESKIVPILILGRTAEAKKLGKVIVFPLDRSLIGTNKNLLLRCLLNVLEIAGEITTARFRVFISGCFLCSRHGLFFCSRPPERPMRMSGAEI